MKKTAFSFILCCMFIHVTSLFAVDNTPLASPKLISNPQNDDEYFFNFRLQWFAPDTEPLIYETFGTGIELENEGFWEYNSYTSHAVSFSTNLPAISVIEYGETQQYGQSTDMSDSYYYQHLHYIKGLRPKTTYHYCIKIQDYEGNLIVSEDHVFTTREYTSDIIRIPEDIGGEAPFVLTESNRKYVLTQNLTVQTVAINIKAHDIELDLDGHTIVYDEGTPTVIGDWWNDYAYDEEATFGIRAGLWNYRNAKIFNGTIRQGKNGGQGYIGIGFNPVFLNHMGAGSYNEVGGITVDYHGPSVSGMMVEDGYTHHNVIIDRGTVIDNRHQGIKAMTMGSNPDNEAAYNSVRRFRHQGIMGNGYKHHNELYSDSFDSNSYLIASGASGRVEYNKMFGMGYNPVGTNWNSNTIISHNFIYLHGTAPNHRSTEYARLSAIAGMRYTLYGDEETIYENSLYEDNTIVLKAWEGCDLARGIWTATGDRNMGVVYRRNTVKVEAISDQLNFTNANTAITCVDINGSDLALDASLPIPMIFEDNHLIGNVNLISFGSSYGIGGSSYFYRTQFERIETYDSHFAPVRLGYWYWNTRDNRIIDAVPENGVDLNPPAFLGNDGYMEISYGQSHVLTVTDKCSGLPLSNKDVTITMNGSRMMEVRSDETGLLRFDLLTVQHLKEGRQISQTDYTSYTFTISGYQPYTIMTGQLKTTNVLAFADPDCDDVGINRNDVGLDMATAMDGVVLYPNPAKDVCILEGLKGNETIRLIDFSGRLVAVSYATNEKEMLPVTTLKAGIYLVRIERSGQTVKTLKLIVSREL